MDIQIRKALPADIPAFFFSCETIFNKTKSYGYTDSKSPSG